MQKRHLLSLAVAPALIATALCHAAATVPVLSPGMTGDFTYVENPTRAAVAALRAAGKKPLVVDSTFADEAVAFTNWAENASAVAFIQLPRLHLMHSWKLLGVKVLKYVRYDDECSADHFRREASFLAFRDGAEGLWLPDMDRFPPDWREAFTEAKEDWRIMLYLKSLADEAAKSEDPAVRIECRRVAFWLGWMPADWENLDTLRLECVAWAKRLEMLLGKPKANLPVARSEPTRPTSAGRLPYFGAPVKPVQEHLKKLGDTVAFDGGLSFKADKNGFSITYSTTNGPARSKHDLPGGFLDFRLYIPGDTPGSFLPYRFHCDFNPSYYSAKRAPATGREGWLFGTDERFRPFYIAYATPNPRVWNWPRLRDYGPDYPDPRPHLKIEANKGGGWRATLEFRWIHLYGHWPMQHDGKNDIWFIGVDKSPETGLPLSGRILWPRGHADFFRTFASSMAPHEMTDAYQRELNRTQKVWTTAYEERLYPYARTPRPSFNRYDVASDAAFWVRFVEPLCITNENAWELIYTDKDHPSKFPGQPENIKMAIWRNFARMTYLSHEVGRRRLAYLEDRFAGRALPPVPKKRKTADEIAAEHKSPDIDYDPDAIQLEEKEY